MPDGSIKFPNGAIKLPDGTWQYPDGSLELKLQRGADLGPVPPRCDAPGQGGAGAREREGEGAANDTAPDSREHSERKDLAIKRRGSRRLA